MIQRGLNIIVLGANYYGMMASSQRIRNLFEPLTYRNEITISNLVIRDINGRDIVVDGNVNFKNLDYNYKNPFSILSFFFLSAIYLLNQKQKSKINILYCYSDPSVENIFILVFSRLLGYKVVFDIVENQNFIENSQASTLRMRIKRHSMVRFQKLIPLLGRICFAISPQLVEFCKKLTRGSIPVVLLPICVNTQKILHYKLDKVRKANIQVFYGGSFGHKDGIDFLIEGFEAACMQSIDLELVLTGRANKNYEMHLLQRINSSVMKDKIRYLGCLSNDEYFSVMVNADILCVTRINSLYANSGFPFKLGEYLASGNAIISTTVGDVSKYLKNKHNAILIKPNSELAIRDAILMLYQDKELRSNIGRSAKETALKYFSSDLISNILWENISKLKNG